MTPQRRLPPQRLPEDNGWNCPCTYVYQLLFSGLQEFEEVAKYLHCVLTVAMVTVSMENPTVPEGLHGTAVVLHGNC